MMSLIIPAILLLPSLIAWFGGRSRFIVALSVTTGIGLAIWSDCLAGLLPAVLVGYAVIWRWL
jgi:hypothetical protein